MDTNRHTAAGRLFVCFRRPARRLSPRSPVPPKAAGLLLVAALRTFRSSGGRRTALLLMVGLGVGSVWGPARLLSARPGDRPPAARLAAPQPLAPANVAARAAPVESVTPTSVVPPPPQSGSPSSTIPESWVTPPAAPMTHPYPGPASPPATGFWGELKQLMASGTRTVKAAVGMGSAEPPQPRIGQLSPPRPQHPFPNGPAGPPQPAPQTPQQPKPPTSTRPAAWDAAPSSRPTDQPIQGTSPDGAPVYAGSPAYRWYGWGATTPGMNPLAPDGEYPRGSANWYAQTGATPGAFPVPVANPFRPPPGSTPPTYLINTPPPPPTPSVFAPPPPSAPRPIAQSPPVGMYVTPTAPVPPPHVGYPTGPAEPRWHPAPTGGPAVPVPPPGPVLPAAHTQQPAAESGWTHTVRGQEPAGDGNAVLTRQIRAACEGLVSGVTVERGGPGRLVVSFAATTETLAEIAANAVSAIPDLRPFTVEFKATIQATAR